MRIDKTATIEALTSENDLLDTALFENLYQIVNLESALLDPRCAGNAYSSIADRIRNLRIPAAKTHNIVFEATIGANQLNIAEISSLPETGSGVLDTDECDKMILELENMNKQFQTMQDALNKNKKASSSQFMGFSNLIEVNNNAITELQAKKDAALQYAAKSSSFYAEAKQFAESLLQQSTNTATSYLNTGTYGDTSWTKDLSTAYENSIMKQYDRYMIKVSAEFPEEAFLSDDYKSIYHNGKKWAIDGPVNEFPTFGSADSPAMTAAYVTVDTKTITVYHFNRAMFYANIGRNAESTKPNCDPRLKYSAQAVAEWNLASLVFDTVGNYSTANEKYEFTLQFKENGIGGQHVSLYSRDEKYVDTHSWVGRSGSYYGHMGSESVYTAVTGKDTSFPNTYDLVYFPDAKKQEDGAPTHYHYFTEDGKMRKGFIRYPDDKVVVKVNLGSTEVVDVTDWYFNAEHGFVDKEVVRKVREELSINE